MNRYEQYDAAPRKPARYLRRGAVRALWVLETCPSVPVDAFVHLAGLSSQSGAYQQLARLRHAGLAIARRVDPGYLMGERPLGCWTITDEGRRILGLGDWRKPGDQEAVPRLCTSALAVLKRPPGESDAPLLLAMSRSCAMTSRVSRVSTPMRRRIRRIGRRDLEAGHVRVAADQLVTRRGSG